MSAPASQSQYNYLIEQAIAAGKRPDISDACVYDVVWSHDQLGGNYEWLWPYYGRVLWIDFWEEKYGKWQTYMRYWWGRHGALVSHDPDKLVEEHVKYYVDPKTRRILLRFWFELPNGIVYSMSPTRHFYELERDYFEAHHLCSSHPEDYEPKYNPYEAPGPEYLYEEEKKHKTPTLEESKNFPQERQSLAQSTSEKEQEPKETESSGQEMEYYDDSEEENENDIEAFLDY